MARFSALPSKTEHALIALLCAIASAPAHAQEACATDADCDGALVCSRVLFGTDCQSGECLEVLEQGFCAEAEPEPLRCDADGECPAPLYCDSQHPSGALCAYVEPTCSSSDSECPTGFMCVDLEPLGGCELCEDTEGGPECSEVPCAESGLNVCSPIAMSCEADDDCGEGFVCREVGAFDVQLGWEESWVGMRACLSVGLIAVQDGVVQGGVDAAPSGSPPDAGVSGAGGAGAGGANPSGPGDAGAAGEAGASGAGAAAHGGEATGSDEDAGSGCSCSIHERSSSRAASIALLAALLMGALMLRRWPVG